SCGRAAPARRSAMSCVRAASSRSFASGRDSSSTRTSPPQRSAGSSIACPARSSAPKEASSASAPSTRGSSGTSPEDARTSPTCRTRRARSSSTSIAARGTTSSSPRSTFRARCCRSRCARAVSSRTATHRISAQRSRSPASRDQQAALFGQTCFSPGQAKNTYGTGCFFLENTGVRAAPPPKGLLTTIAWDTGEGLRYALEGSAFITGAAVQWLRDGLGLIKSAEETDAIARSIQTNDNVYFVPAFTGLGAPYWDPRARGVLIGLE